MSNKKVIAPIAIIFIILFLIVASIFIWRYLEREEIKTPESKEKEELITPFKEELITPSQVITEMMEMLVREIERKAEKEGMEIKITEEEKEKLKEEIRQKIGGKDLGTMTQEEFEDLKTKMKEDIIPAMAEVIIQLQKTRTLARDARRTSDMRQIGSAQEMYYGEDEQYYQSVNYPISIPNFMMGMPTDPSTGGPYGWIDNTKDNQKFCAYATLEKGGWCTASHRGVYTCSDVRPTLDDCCF